MSCGAAHLRIPWFFGVWAYLFYPKKFRVFADPEILVIAPVGQTGRRVGTGGPFPAQRAGGRKQKTPQLLAGSVFYRCVHQSIE
jgi:hypothetical protein